MNALMFIKKVSYTKTVDDGSKATLVLIPADTTFEKTWQNKGTSVTKVTKAAKNLK